MKFFLLLLFAHFFAKGMMKDMEKARVLDDVISAHSRFLMYIESKALLSSHLSHQVKSDFLSYLFFCSFSQLFFLVVPNGPRCISGHFPFSICSCSFRGFATQNIFFFRFSLKTLILLWTESNNPRKRLFEPPF